jgi:hypothetical protein
MLSSAANLSIDIGCLLRGTRVGELDLRHEEAVWHGTSIGWTVKVTIMPRCREKFRPILATVQDRPLTEIAILC